MVRNVVDTDWVLRQFDSADVDPQVRVAVLKLIEAWETVDEDKAQIDKVIEVFSSAIKGHSLLPSQSDEVWVEVLPGFVHTGDVVRVRHDAFDTDVGLYHNGRVGKVVGVRSGSIFFRSTDDISPFIDGARYSPQHLERKLA